MKYLSPLAIEILKYEVSQEDIYNITFHNLHYNLNPYLSSYSEALNNDLGLSGLDWVNQKATFFLLILEAEGE